MLHHKHKIVHVYLSVKLASKQQQATTVTSHQSHDSDTHYTRIHFNLGSKALWYPLSSTQRATCLERLWNITTLAVTQGTRANQYRTARLCGRCMICFLTARLHEGGKKGLLAEEARLCLDPETYSTRIMGVCLQSAVKLQFKILISCNLAPSSCPILWTNNNARMNTEHCHCEHVRCSF